MDEFRRTEIEVNVALAGALSNRHPRWDARSMLPEKTGVLKSTDNRKRPDILVMEDSRWPVGIETEFMPARTVEKEAEERLRKKVARTGEPIESVIAVRLPIHLATDPEMDVESVTFDYATYSLDADGNTTRYPPSDADVKWISGDLSDLADAVEHLSLSERRLAEGTRLLEETVSATAERINERVPENLIQDISKFLHQSPDTQTLRMAGAIITSAFVFHSAIDGQPDIPRISELLPPNVLTQSKLLTSWTEILKVNYWPIFSIAHGVIQSMPNRNFTKILEPVLEGVEKLASIGATTYHDLCGRMFQTLITDRKFLATFYTLPTSACLLAELAVGRLSVDWGNRESIGSLRIGDFACGTGALLSAVQRAIHRRYRRSGGDDRDLHRQMMEQQLVGLDIMPAAAHLTCSMLSSTHPGVGYGRSNIQTMPYGEFDGAVHIGSLDLLGDDRVIGLFDIEAQRQTSSGIETSGNEFTARDGSFDLVIMNPPFTRATANEKPHHGIRIPSFAGLSTSDEEQKLMTQKLSSMPKFAGHGRAGLATNFLDLAHVKLKDNGVLALILPLTFANGSTWAKSRKLLLEHYRDVFVIGIASYGNSKQAFSADTSIGECLLLATKGSQNQSVSTWNLSARPQSLFHASLVAKSFDTSRSLNSLNALGVRERDVAIAAIQMVSGVLQLPRQAPRELPLVQLDKVAERGIEHKLINDRKIGSFNTRSMKQEEVPSFPTLWKGDAERETRLMVEADSVAEVREGCEEKARSIWNRIASRLHVNYEFGFGSQSLAMCLTPEPSIGGRAWPNVIPNDESHEIPLLLWANTTLGLICFWWHGTRQQPGRSIVTVSNHPNLMVLDTRTLTVDQLEKCDLVFEEIKDREFLPANEAYRDETRKLLDRYILLSVLGLGEEILSSLDTLRKQWCAEPSVHDAKSMQ